MSFVLRGILSVLLLSIHGEAAVFKGYDNIPSIEEGSCVPPYPKANLDKNFLNTMQPDGGFYMPLSSQLEAISLATSILGRDLNSADNTRDYCLRKTYIKTSRGGELDVAIFSGFGNRTASLFCDILDDFGNEQKCYVKNNEILLTSNNDPFKSVMNHEPARPGNTKGECICGTPYHVMDKVADTYWTLTDQETFVVIVICTEEHKMWNVISTKPILEETVVTEITAHVLKLGFDKIKFNMVDFSLC